jgi:ribose-phosphate pyrophosphokinase
MLIEPAPAIKVQRDGRLRCVRPRAIIRLTGLRQGGGAVRIFALDASREFGTAVARALGVEPARHEERAFEDGEHKLRPLESVRGRDAYLVQALYGGPELSPGEKLCRLLFLAAAVRDHGARRVTAVIPYLAYARKDRRTQPRDPVTSRYVAQLVEAVGIDRVVAIDVHNPAAFENAFRIPTVHLEARPLLVRHLSARLRGEAVAVVSPDAGGAKRATLLRDTLAAALGTELPLAFLEKQRSGGVIRGGETVAGEVAGRVAVIVDDLVSSGSTLARAAAACRARGATRVVAAVTHGLFTGDADAVLGTAGLDTLLVTDTVPPFRLRRETVAVGLTLVEAAPLVALAIRRLHDEGGVQELSGLGPPHASASDQDSATSR